MSIKLSRERLGQVALCFAHKIAVDKTLETGRRPSKNELVIIAEALAPEIVVSLEDTVAFLNEIYGY